MKQVYPEPTVGLYIFKKGKLLLTKSPKWKGLYSVPGGHVELGETIEEAAKREAKEEVGLDIKLEKIFMIQESIYSKQFSKKRHFIFIECLCRTKGKVKIDNYEITDYVWVDAKEALKLKLDSFTRKGIKKILDEKLI